MIRLVALDMDNTLLDSRKRLPVDFMDWVRSHPEIKVVIGSGRQYFTLRDNMQGIEDLILYDAENGALVFDQGVNIYCDAMQKEDILAVLDEMEKIPDTAVILCAVQSAYMQHSFPEAEEQAQIYYHHLTFLEDLRQCPEMDEVVKVTAYFRNHDSEKWVKGIHLRDAVHPAVSGPDWIDFNNSSVNKGTGIRMIQKKYGITREESMAFGDAMNDLEMLQACEESYAMKNGMEELKKAAKHVTEYSNDEDGVMRVLRTL
ncbi:MAG: HAD family hydrolase [Bulleidia sp.]|nr:HAD family hydrolase [Bulleidia sp.]